MSAATSGVENESVPDFASLIRAPFAGKLPVAGKGMVGVVIAAATIATPIAAIRDSEHALDGAHRAADAGADRAANHPTHGAANPVAFVSTLLRAAHDALRMTDMGDREQREHQCRSREIKLYGQAGRQRR